MHVIGKWLPKHRPQPSPRFANKIQHGIATFDDVQSTTPENGHCDPWISAKRTRTEEKKTDARTSKGQPRVSRLFLGPHSPFTVTRPCQLSKQLQMRLQYAKLKVEHGWVREVASFSNPCRRAHRCARASNDKTSTRSKTSTFTTPTYGACDRVRGSDPTMRP